MQNIDFYLRNTYLYYNRYFLGSQKTSIPISVSVFPSQFIETYALLLFTVFCATSVTFCADCLYLQETSFCHQSKKPPSQFGSRKTFAKGRN